MKAKIAVGLAVACIPVAAYAWRNDAQVGPPTPPIAHSQPVAPDGEDVDTPDPLPGQVMAVTTTSRGRVFTTIYAAPPAPEGTIVVRFEGPPRKGHFRVHLALLEPVEVGEEALAKQVQEVLRKERPMNPGRSRSFGPLEVPKHPYGPFVWDLAITSVKPIPGGWNATIWVWARIENCYPVHPVKFENYHEEVYRFERGRLTLESESLDPGWKPAKATRIASPASS